MTSPPIPLYQPNDLLLICCHVWWQSTNFPVPDGRFTFSGSSFWSSDVTSGLVTSPSIPLYQLNDLLLSFCQVWWQSTDSPVPDGRFTSSGSSFWSYDVTSGFVTSPPIPLCHPPDASLAFCQIWCRSDDSFRRQPRTDTQTHRQTHRHKRLIYID